jgi:hypothetical protein
LAVRRPMPSLKQFRSKASFLAPIIFITVVNIHTS